MMAGAYLVAFVSGIGSGFIARWYEPLGGTGFWLLNAGISLMTMVLVVLFGGTLRRCMDAVDQSAASIRAE